MSVNVLAGPVETEVLKTEAALEALWAARPPHQGGPQARASMLNLLAVTESTQAAEAAAEVIGKMIGRAPCRAILIDNQPEVDPPGLKVEVSLIAEPAPLGARQACCELIRLTATGFSADGLPSAATALYTPDVPILLWWSAPAFQREDFKRFASEADRVIVDSRQLSRDGLQEVAAFLRQSRRTRTAVCDLNWARLTPYRQLFAQFFDAAQWRSQLDTIEHVQIEAQENAGLMMASWLLSRLGNRISANKIDVAIKQNGEIVFGSLIMKCAGGEFRVTRVNHEMVEAYAQVDGETVSRTARIPLASVETLLADELAFAGRDRAYDATMEWASLIAPLY